MKYFLWVLTFSVAVSAADSPAGHPKHKVNWKNDRLCKVFKQKIVDYKKTMRHDKYAKATLESYKKRAAMFCGE